MLSHRLLLVFTALGLAAFGVAPGVAMSTPDDPIPLVVNLPIDGTIDERGIVAPHLVYYRFEASSAGTYHLRLTSEDLSFNYITVLRASDLSSMGYFPGITTDQITLDAGSYILEVDTYGGVLTPAAGDFTLTVTYLTGAPYEDLVGLGGKCLTVSDPTAVDRTPVVLSDCDGSPSQLWSRTADGTIVGLGGRCLDVLGGGGANRTPVGIFRCRGTANQRWELRPNGRLVGLSNKCLDIEGGSSVNGTPAILFTCHGRPNQQWSPHQPTLALRNERFAATVRWRDPNGSGRQGIGHALPLSSASGIFWFFDPDNVELVVKVIDGTVSNNRHWVFYGALSDVEYELQIQDLRRGTTRTYFNPAGNLCGRGDVGAFFPLTADDDDSATSDPGAALDAALDTPVAMPFQRLDLEVPVDGKAGTCVATNTTLCLFDNRFEVKVDWRYGTDTTGVGRAVPGSDESGFFWFFDRSNIELVVKVLDGTAFNGNHWFFYGALSDVEYFISVRDTLTGAQNLYYNPPGNLCGRGDIRAF